MVSTFANDDMVAMAATRDTTAASSSSMSCHRSDKDTDLDIREIDSQHLSLVSSDDTW